MLNTPVITVDKPVNIWYNITHNITLTLRSKQMPIAQSRVIALINAALDCYQAVHRIQSQTKAHIEFLSKGMSPDQALNDLALLIADNEALFRRYSETRHTIELELQWYNTHAASNALSAQKMRDLRARRRADGTMPEARRRQHIPKSLYETEQIYEPNAMASYTKTYVTASTKIGLVSEQEREDEIRYQAAHNEWLAKGTHDPGTCIRQCGMSGDIPWCPIEDRNNVCPSNRIRVWEKAYAGLKWEPITPLTIKPHLTSQPSEDDIVEEAPPGTDDEIPIAPKGSNW